MNASRLFQRPGARRERAATVLLALGVAAAARADGPVPESRAMLIDEQLATRTVEVVSLDDRVLVFIDEQQRQRTLTRASLLAIIPEHDTDRVPRPVRASPMGLLTLTSGERFEGDLLPTGGDDESIAWTHPSLGKLSFPIERVASFWRSSADDSVRGAAIASAREDVLILNNGDSLAGFLASAGDPLRIEADGAITDVAADRVIGARLVNPSTPPSGARLWIEGGTTAEVSHVAIESVSRATFTLPGGASSSINWNQVHGVLFDAARLRPLAGIAPTKQTAAKDRRYTAPITASADAPLDAADLYFPGPMSVTWTLPEGTRRIAFTAALADGAAPWGDCELIVSVDGNELSRRRLTAETPPTPVALSIAGETLTIEVDPGKYGPIRDWVVILRPMLLVGARAGASSSE